MRFCVANQRGSLLAFSLGQLRLTIYVFSLFLHIDIAVGSIPLGAVFAERVGNVDQVGQVEGSQVS